MRTKKSDGGNSTALVASKRGKLKSCKNYRKALDSTSGITVRLKGVLTMHTDTEAGYNYSV